MKASACLFARKAPKLAITFSNIVNMLEWETEFPCADLMNYLKTAITSFSLAKSSRIRAARASVSSLSFVLQKANDLHPMCHNIDGNFPVFRATLYRRYADKGDQKS
jgi:hypothetical protein